jgi:UPF0042 nucleotide-binding protein
VHGHIPSPLLQAQHDNGGARLECLAGGEVFVGAVPVGDGGFAGFPAQEDGAAVTERGEVEEAEVEILYQAAVGLDAVDDAHDFRLKLGGTARLAAAFGGRGAGAAARPAQLGVLLEQPDGELAALAPELFDKRSKHRNEGVGFFGRKETHAHVLRRPSVTFSRFVVVTGLSGAGKSQAMKSFEDLGFYCLDHLPPALLIDLVTLARRAGIARIALSLDARVGGAFGDPLEALAQLEKLGVSFEVLYLDANDEALVRRYSETRRRHPREDAGTLTEAIALERADLAPLRERATLVLDTSRFTHGSLKAHIVAAYANEPTARRLSVHVVAFGYKFGLPRDADLVFDVRFLPNPNYVPELKKLSGTDRPVVEFMEALPETETFVGLLFAMIDFLVPLYIGEGKSRLTIAIGCTGGRHRSVYVANRLSAHLKGIVGLTVASEHRELVSA